MKRPQIYMYFYLFIFLNWLEIIFSDNLRLYGALKQIFLVFKPANSLFLDDFQFL